MSNQFISANEIAKELGVTKVTVTTWIREGRLKAFKAGKAQNSAYLITIDEFERFKDGYVRWGHTKDKNE